MNVVEIDVVVLLDRLAEAHKDIGRLEARLQLRAESEISTRDRLSKLEQIVSKLSATQGGNSK